MKLSGRATAFGDIAAALVVLVGGIIPFTPLGSLLGFTPLSPGFLLFLIGATATYLLLVELVKRKPMQRLLR